MGKVLILFLILFTPLTAQQQPKDTVAVKSVEDTVNVKQTGPLLIQETNPVSVEQDRWVRIAVLAMPVLVILGGALQGYIGVLAKRAENAANLAVILQQKGEKKHTAKLNRIERLGNSLSDAQNQRIDDLTAALVAGKLEVPARVTKTHGGSKKSKASARAKAQRNPTRKRTSTRR